MSQDRGSEVRAIDSGILVDTFPWLPTGSDIVIIVFVAVGGLIGVSFGLLFLGIGIFFCMLDAVEEKVRVGFSGKGFDVSTVIVKKRV
jgi:apolipoprotein N-acyltransferase